MDFDDIGPSKRRALDVCTYRPVGRVCALLYGEELLRAIPHDRRDVPTGGRGRS